MTRSMARQYVFGLLVTCSLVAFGETSLTNPYISPFVSGGELTSADLAQINSIVPNIFFDFNVSGVDPAALQNIQFGVVPESLLAPTIDFNVDIVVTAVQCTDWNVQAGIDINGFLLTIEKFFELQGQICIDSQVITCSDLVRSPFLSDLGDFTNYQQYRVDINGSDISTMCQIDAEVVINSASVGGNFEDTSSWVFGPSENFYTKGNDISMLQIVRAYSTDFVNDTASFARAEDCELTLGNTAFNLSKVIEGPGGSAFLPFPFRVDIGPAVSAILQNTAAIFWDPIGGAACDISKEAGAVLADVIVNSTDNPDLPNISPNISPTEVPTTSPTGVPSGSPTPAPTAAPQTPVPTNSPNSHASSIRVNGLLPSLLLLVAFSWYT